MQKSVMQSGRRLASALLFGSLTLVVSCTTAVQKPNKTEAEAVRAGQKAIILFRVTTTDSRTNEPIKHLHLDSVAWDFWGLDNWDKPESVRSKYHNAWRDKFYWRVPSESDGRCGWRYLVIDHGNYFVRVVPEEASQQILGYDYSKKKSFLDQFPAYQINIPPDRSVVYAGSFHFDRLEERRGGWLGIPEATISFRPQGVENEIIAAKLVGAEAPFQFSSMTPSIAVPYNDLRAAVNKQSKRVVRIESTDGISLAAEDVGIKAAQIAATPLATPGVFLIETADGSTGQTVAGVALLLAGAPFAIVADKTFGEAARKVWAPHVAELTKAAENYRLHDQLVDALKQRLTKNQTNASSGEVELVIQLRPYHLLLRNTQKKKYALETAVHVSVRDALSNTMLWQNGFVCSYENVVTLDSIRGRFETALQYSPASYPLEAFKSEGGVQLLKKELDRIVTTYTEEIARRIEEAGLIGQ